METIANICKGTENLGNNQTDLKLNAFEVGENLVAFLVPHFANFVITNYTITEDEVALTLKSKSTCTCCDRCHIETHHTRGWQKRKVTMPPLGGKRFTLILYMRKFHCKADGHFFTEQQPDWLNKYARFSIDCTRLMNQVHLQMSSVSASRILSDMGIHCCPNTCINHLKNIKLAPDRTATNIGIDDFAKRKGHSYGSAIVNHDTGQVLELIDSRDSEKVAEVLSLYHHVSTITRDRGKCYIKAIKKALPAATVVADKFHIMENLTKALFPQVQSRFLHERKRLLDKSKIGPKPPVLDQSWVLQGIYASLDSMSKDVEKAKTLAKRKLCLQMHVKQELSIKDIHDKTGYSSCEIKKLLDATYESFLNPSQLWVYKNVKYISDRILEKKTLEYSGVVKGVHGSGKKYAMKMLLSILREKWKNEYGEYKERMRKFLSKESIRMEEHDLWNAIVHFNSRPKTESVKIFMQQKNMYDLKYFVSTFQGILSGENKMGLYKWINMAIGCGEDGIEKFAMGLLDDYQAIKNSITSKWNNGILEGTVCKIKTAKRIMAGRASITLLEKKVALKL